MIRYFAFFLQISSISNLLCAYLYYSMKECFLCDYQSYYINENNSINQTICLPKNLTATYIQSILIYTSQYNNTIFPDNFHSYSNFIEAFLSETQNSMQFYQSNLTFYFTQGDHHKTSTNLIYTPNLFRRINAYIILKPLYCVDYFYDGCVNIVENPNIFLNSIDIKFYISGDFIIENLNFYGDSFDFQDFYEFSAITEDINKNDDSYNEYGLFNIELIFDDPVIRIPKLSIYNVSFFNFLDGLNRNSLIEMSNLGGQITLDNVSFVNVELIYSIMHFTSNNYNIEADITKYFNIKQYQVECLKIHINNMYISEENMLEIYKTNQNSWFFFNGWLGSIEIINSYIDGIVGYNKKAEYFFYFWNSLQAIHISNLTISNFIKLSLLLLNNASLIINHLLISSYSSDTPFITIQSLSNFTVYDLYFHDKNTNSDYLFISAIDSFINMTALYMINILYGGFYISQSRFLLSYSTFINVMNNDYLFFFDQSWSNICYCEYMGIYVISNVFYFYKIISEITHTNFSQINSNSIIMPSKLDFQSLDFCLFYNISQTMNIWSYNSILYTLNLNNTAFFNSTLYSFLFILSNELIANINNLSIINIEGLTSNIFIAIMTYSIVNINSSNFINISFYELATHFIEMDFSQILFDNSNFINVGWKSFSIDRFLSSEDNCLCYFWGFKASIIQNSYFFSSFVSLFSGFLFFTIGNDSIKINNNSFIAADKEYDKYYQGLVISDSSYVELCNNIFKGLVCTRSNSTKLRKFDGVISLNGGSGSFLLKNTKKIYMRNNSFYNCCCHGKGGSVYVINYQQLNFEIINFFYSYGQTGGCFYMFGIQNANISNLTSHFSKSNSSALHFQSVFFIILYDLVIVDSWGLASGSISARYLNDFIITKVYIFKSLGNQSAGSLFIDSGNIKISSFFVNDSVSNASGGVAYFTGRSQILIENSFFTETYGYIGGVIYANGEILLSFINSVIFACQALSGAGIYISDILQFNLNNISIISCYTKYQGSIFLSSKGYMYITGLFKISCLNNIASDGSCMYFEAGVEAKLENFYIKANENSIFSFSWPNFCLISLYNITFIENIIKTAMIISENIVINAEFLYFMNNTIDVSNSDSYYSYIYLKDSDSDDNDFKSISIFQNDSQIYHNKKIFSLFYVYGSYLHLKNISFNIGIIDIKVEFFFIFTINNENVIIIQNSFIEKTPIKYGVKKGLIVFYGSILQIINTTFTDINDICLVIYNSNVSLSYVIFNGNNANQDIYVEKEVLKDFYYLKIENSYFQTIQSVCATILNYNLINLSNILYNNSNAIYNLDETGNQYYALDLQENLDILLFQCHFFNFSSYIGGALKITSNKPFTALSLNIFECIFYDNIADIYYPTFLSEAAIIDIAHNAFHNNHDPYHIEPSFSSFPSLIKTSDISKTIISGIPFNISFKITDIFMNDILLDFNATATIKEDIFSKNYTNDLFIMNNFASSQRNYINFTDLMIHSNSHSIRTLILEITYADFFSELYKEKIKYDSLNISIQLFLRNCQIGEIVTPNLTCYKCPIGYYSLINPMNSTNSLQKCKNCLKNAYCNGGNLIIPSSGYWIYSNDSEYVVECINYQNCINSFNNTSLVLKKCKTGNTGNLCFYCEISYYLSVNNECAKCNEFDFNCLINLILSILLMILFIVINTVMIKRGNRQPKNDFSIIIKIFINYLQTAGLILSCNRNFLVTSITDLLSTIQTISLVNSNFLSCQCLLPKILRELIDIFIFRHIATILLPIIFWILCFIYFIIKNSFSVLGSQSKSWKKTIFENISICFVICVYILYPLIAKSSFSLFNCIPLSDKTAKTFLLTSPNLVCWESNHLEYLALLGFPSLLVWGVSFPLFILVTGIKKIYIINKVKEELKKLKSLPFDQPVYQKYYSKKYLLSLQKNHVLKFFTDSYKPKYCFWDAFIFFRKFFVTFIVSLCSSISSEISTMALISILGFGAILTIVFKPYKYKNCNNYEILSLISNIYTIITSFLVNSNIKDSYKIIILCSCLMINLVVVFFCLIHVILFIFSRFRKVTDHFVDYFKFLQYKSTFKMWRKRSLMTINSTRV